MKFWNSEVPQVNQDNRIIINIWLAKLNGQETKSITYIKKIKEQKSKPHVAILDPNLPNRVGHVSMQTNNQYVSWWPNPKNDEEVGLFNVIGSANSNFATDCNSEGGFPDLIICLYSLDIKNIEEAFKKVEKSDYGYVLAGDKAIVRTLNKPKGQSCCGLAYELLEIGGILKLSSYYKDITMKWLIVTMDNFPEFLRNIKQQELIKFPETQSYPILPSEYSPQVVQQKNLCNIM